MKVRINSTIHARDDAKSTNRLSEDGREILGNLVGRIIPPMTPVDLPDEEARYLLDAFPGSLEVGKESAEDLEWIAEMEKSRNEPRLPTQTPTRSSMQTPPQLRV